MEFISQSALETEEFAENFAKNILRMPRKSPRIFLFFGDLGSGKTTFLRGFARGLGISDRISSPTFSLLHLSELPKNVGFSHFAHFDLYRADENSALGFFEFTEYCADKKTICAVEWAEKLPPDFFPEGAQKITFEKRSETERKITISEARPREVVEM